MVQAVPLAAPPQLPRGAVEGDALAAQLLLPHAYPSKQVPKRENWSRDRGSAFLYSCHPSHQEAPASSPTPGVLRKVGGERGSHLPGIIL